MSTFGAIFRIKGTYTMSYVPATLHLHTLKNMLSKEYVSMYIQEYILHTSTKIFNMSLFTIIQNLERN